MKPYAGPNSHLPMLQKERPVLLVLSGSRVSPTARHPRRSKLIPKDSESLLTIFELTLVFPTFLLLPVQLERRRPLNCDLRSMPFSWTYRSCVRTRLVLTGVPLPNLSTVFTLIRLLRKNTVAAMQANTSNSEESKVAVLRKKMFNHHLRSRLRKVKRLATIGNCSGADQ